MKIKNLLSNKKTLLSLIAGVTITLGAIAAGTYAWFTDTADVDISGDFTTAFVGVQADDMELNVYDFYPGDYPLHQTVERQGALEGNFNNFWDVLNNNGKNYTTDWITNETKYNNMLEFRYATFWSYMPPQLGGTNDQWPEVNIFDIDEVPADLSDQTEYSNNRVNLIKNAFGKFDGTVVNVTPSSIVEATYGFAINRDGGQGGYSSSIPVYFRVPAFKVNIESEENLAYTMNAIAEITGPTDVSFSVPLVQVDDYYYCSVPLSPEYGWEVKIGIYAYISGEQNGNEMQSMRCGFAGEDSDMPAVEVIQATNNAVFLADGWKDAAMSESVDSIVSPAAPGLSGTFFEPYVDADMYSKYLDLWGY